MKTWTNLFTISAGTTSLVLTAALFIILVIAPGDIITYQTRILLGYVMAVELIAGIVFFIISAMRYGYKPINLLTGKELIYFDMCYSVLVLIFLISSPFTINTLNVVFGWLGPACLIAFMIAFWCYYNYRITKRLKQAKIIAEN